MKRSIPAFLAAALFAVACTDQATDADLVVSSLEEENGGLDMEDEAPMFGADDEFAAASMEQSRTVADPLADDELTTTELELDGAVAADVLLVWGQLPPDRAPEDYARDWSGTLSINRGGLIVRRTLNFEPATDRLLDRTDRAVVGFESVTRPFVDGLVLTVVDPTPDAGPLVVTYTPVTGAARQLELASVLAGPVVVDVADQGDRFAAIAIRRGDDCDHGFARGRWHAFREDVGAMLGVIDNAEGEPIGHLRGIWGRRRDGQQVFFGKYIDLAGHFRGIFAGHYEGGEMAGRWIDSRGELGRLHGLYRESIPGPAVGGQFILRWSETSCAGEIPAE